MAEMLGIPRVPGGLQSVGSKAPADQVGPRTKLGNGSPEGKCHGSGWGVSALTFKNKKMAAARTASRQ
jgi:hypothetical protein